MVELCLQFKEGGVAYAQVNSTIYSAGEQSKPEESKNRVNTANVTINNGIINSETVRYGLVFGGGQGYSYTGKVNLVINGGDMSSAYVTAGGSNGYTGEADVSINGGNIKIFQSVNRGKMNFSELTMTGGDVQNLYVGGEKDGFGVDGTINNVEVSILGGKVNNLESGTSNSSDITVGSGHYSVVSADGTVTNNNIKGDVETVSYEIKINEGNINLGKDETKDLTVSLTTEPTGYEDKFDLNNVEWSSSNQSVAEVNANGVVTARGNGTSVITATLLESKSEITATVTGYSSPVGLQVALSVLFIVFLIAVVVLATGF